MNPKHGRDLFHRERPEEPQLGNPCVSWIELAESVERVAEVNQAECRAVSTERLSGECKPVFVSTPLECVLGPRVIGQDLPHRAGRQRQEVRTIIDPVGTRRELDPDLVDERCRLERVVMVLFGEHRPGQRPQFLAERLEETRQITVGNGVGVRMWQTRLVMHTVIHGGLYGRGSPDARLTAGRHHGSSRVDREPAPLGRAPLTPAWFELDAGTPRVVVAAAYSRGRRRDELPIRRDIAELLRPLIDRTTPDSAIWPDLPRAMGQVLAADLEPAGIAETDDEGRVADFHALRHRFVSRLASSGVQPKVARRFARRSTITLTMDRYAQVDRTELADAIECLSQLQIDRRQDQANSSDTFDDRPASPTSIGSHPSDDTPNQSAAPPQRHAGSANLAEPDSKAGARARQTRFAA